MKNKKSNEGKRLQVKVQKLWKAAKKGDLNALQHLSQLMDENPLVARIIEALESTERSGTLGRNIHNRPKKKGEYIRSIQGGAPGLRQQRNR